MLTYAQIYKQGSIKFTEKNHGGILVLCQLLEHKTKHGTLSTGYTHRKH